jgi:hypothetical protein
LQFKTSLLLFFLPPSPVYTFYLSTTRATP